MTVIKFYLEYMVTPYWLCPNWSGYDLLLLDPERATKNHCQGSKETLHRWPRAKETCMSDMALKRCAQTTDRALKDVRTDDRALRSYCRCSRGLITFITLLLSCQRWYICRWEIHISICCVSFSHSCKNWFSVHPLEQRRLFTASH